MLAALILPPVGPLLLVLAAGLLAMRRRGARLAGAVAAGLAALLLALGMPVVSARLVASLEAPAAAPAAGTPAPAAIIVLGGDARWTRGGLDVGPLTLERLRGGAALHRRTGLPVLVTAGPQQRREPALGTLMARSLEADFGIPVRWVEPRARDTRDNAVLSAAMLRAEGIASALVVTHAWHMPRALEAFGRLPGFAATAAPLAPRRVPPGDRLGEWVPRADHLAESWFALHEWAGRLAYAIRDGRGGASLVAGTTPAL